MKGMSLIILVLIISSSVFSQANESSIGNKVNIKSSILILSQDDLFKSSLPGVELLRIFEERQSKLVLEARKIEQEFITEEMELTKQRPLLNIEDFQILADEFDLKVEKMRKLRTDKDKKLQREFMNWRKKFVQVVIPIIRDAMEQFDASIVLDSKNSGLIYDQKIDVTERIINVLNKKFKENPQMLYQILSEE